MSEIHSAITAEPSLVTTSTQGVGRIRSLVSRVDTEPRIGKKNISMYRIEALNRGGLTVKQIKEDFPSLSKEEIAEAIAYARRYPSSVYSYSTKSAKRALLNSELYKVE